MNLPEHVSTSPLMKNPPGESAVLAHLRAIAAEKLELPPAQLALITPDLALVEGLQLDSLAQVTLLAAIEDDFGMTIDFEDREKIHTVADLVNLIRGQATRSVPCS